MTDWGYALPADMEGLYEVYLRSTDGFDNRGRPSAVWRGLIDMVAPTVVGSGQQIGSGASAQTEYTFTFTDFLLDENSYIQPCNTGSLVSLRYDDPALPHNGLPYQVTATCTVDGHETSRDLTACDTVGHCTTITVNPTQVTVRVLTVSTAGTGSGAVSSYPAGITCGADCTEEYAVGTVVTLTASANTGSTFTGWSGACSGMDDCVVTMDTAQSVTATFAIVQPNEHALSVLLAGNGSGSVTGTGIDCSDDASADCSEIYAANTVVTLTAVADADSTFTGWSGDCTNTTGDCVVTITGAKSVTGTFTKDGYGLYLPLVVK
jgi:hypothetical protein